METHFAPAERLSGDLLRSFFLFLVIMRLTKYVLETIKERRTDYGKT